MINKIKLENFTAFKKLEVAFSPKINVIIGENGTGKTHLLKVAYVLCSANKPELRNIVSLIAGIAKAGDIVSANKPELKNLPRLITEKLVSIFKPEDAHVGKLWQRRSNNHARIFAEFCFEKNISLAFRANSVSVNVEDDNEYMGYSWEPVFIPTKEVLSFFNGFVSLYDMYVLPFDGTYRDICQILELPELRSEKLQEKSKWMLKEIENICKGKFIFKGGNIHFKAVDKDEFAVNMIAEGFRKLGVLYRLLETGAINPGISGPLFWDEPEANLNPRLLKLLVNILLELSRKGQQIILTTHNYVLLKEFDLLKRKSDEIYFHALYRDGKNKEITIQSVKDYLQIHPNAISDTFADLMDRDINNSMGGLGR